MATVWDEGDRLVSQGMDEAREEGLALLGRLERLLRQGDQDGFLRLLKNQRQGPAKLATWHLDEEITPADDPDEDGETLAMIAADLGLERALEGLLDAGAHPDVLIEQLTALRAAASAGHAGCVRLLLARGASVEGPRGDDQQRVPPLSCACSLGQVECCLILLEAGADPQRQDWRGETAAQSARAKGTPGALACAEAIDAWVEARDLARELRAQTSPAPSSKAKPL